MGRRNEPTLDELVEARLRSLFQTPEPYPQWMILTHFWPDPTRWPEWVEAILRPLFTPLDDLDLPTRARGVFGTMGCTRVVDVVEKHRRLYIGLWRNMGETTRAQVVAVFAEHGVELGQGGTDETILPSIMPRK